MYFCPFLYFITTNYNKKKAAYLRRSKHAFIHPKNFRAEGGIRTPDQLITNQLLWPAELLRLLLIISTK